MEIAIRPEVEDLKPFRAFETIQVACDADLVIAADTIKEVRARRKAIENFHQEMVGPFKKSIRAFEERLRGPRQFLEGLEDAIKRKMEAYWDSQRQAKLEQEQKSRAAEIEAAKQLANENLEVAIRTGSDSAKEAALNFDKQAERLESKPLNLSQTVRTPNATIAQRLVWEWELVDISKVPRELFILDEKQLTFIARCFDSKPMDIPGIAFKQVSRASAVR